MTQHSLAKAISSGADTSHVVYSGGFLSRGNPRGARRPARSQQLSGRRAANKAGVGPGGHLLPPQRAAHGSTPGRAGRQGGRLFERGAFHWLSREA